MNTPFLAVSVLSLGIMAGITATHYKHVDHFVKYGVPLVVPVALHNDDSALNRAKAAKTSTVKSVNQRGILKNSIRERSSKVSAGTPKVANNEREDILLEIIKAIREEQKAIRLQISESNRDIDELTFRVDTHSESFKPLHSNELDRPRSLINGGAASSKKSVETGLLPPKQ